VAIYNVVELLMSHNLLRLRALSNHMSFASIGAAAQKWLNFHFLIQSTTFTVANFRGLLSLQCIQLGRSGRRPLNEALQFPHTHPEQVLAHA